MAAEKTMSTEIILGKIGRQIIKKWFNEEYEFEIEVTGFLLGNHTERYCRNGEEIGDKYHCTYGCPVNQHGYGICSKRQHRAILSKKSPNIVHRN